jgi:signal transduction histidine kinase
MVLLLAGDGLVRESNGALETRCGHDVIGRPLADLLEPASQAKLRNALEGEGAPVLVEVVLAGALTPTAHAFALVREPGSADAWLFEQVAQERERLTRALAAEAEAREAAQNALAQRDEVLGVVAHDLRNPLNVISMAAKQLRLQAGVPPELSLLDIVDRVVRKMDRLIGDLLDVRRLDAGTLRLAPAAFEVGELLAEACEEMGHVATRRGVQLTCQSGPLPLLKADRGRLVQVLINLVENAIRITPAGAAVVVSARAVEGAIELAVQDSGPGIAADELPHLFDRFWQGRGGGSAGLGLAIVKGIVQAHGGSVSVDSTPGAGSTFRVRLPQASA